MKKNITINTNMHTDVIDLAHTDDELQYQLLENLQIAISAFLDQEEKLGYLKQPDLDKFINLENLLQDLLTAIKNRNNSTTKTIVKEELLYVLPSDPDDGKFALNIKSKKNQSEL